MLLLLHVTARLLFFECIHCMDSSCKLLLKTIAPGKDLSIWVISWNSQVYVFVVSFFSPSNGSSHVRAIHKQYWLQKSIKLPISKLSPCPLLHTLIREMKPSLFKGCKGTYHLYSHLQDLSFSDILPVFLVSTCNNFGLKAGKLFYLWNMCFSS